jgi:hypothetical protein
MNRRECLLAPVLASAASLLPTRVAGQEKHPKEIDKSVRDAWMLRMPATDNATGYMGLNARRTLEFSKESAGLQVAIPAFRTQVFGRRDSASRFLGLPTPEGRFGLCVTTLDVGEQRGSNPGQYRENSTPTNAVDQLAGYENLTYLQLRGTLFQNANVEGLAEMKGLTHLDLWGTWVSGPGLKHVAGVKGLRYLYLAGAPIPGAWLKYLTGLEKLNDLVADADLVGDGDLKHVAGIKTLTHLALRPSPWFETRSCYVSDAGLKHLAGMKQLARVQLGHHKVTEAGLMEFRKALPKCEVVDGDGKLL